MDDMRKKFEIAFPMALWDAAEEQYNDVRMDFAYSGFQAGVANMQGKQEPVAWLSIDILGERYLSFSPPRDCDTAQPLYSAPQPIASIEPAHWVIKTGHGTHYRDTPPSSDVVVNWTPLFTSPLLRSEQKQVSSFTKESWDAFEYQFDRDSSNDNVTEALKAVWECLTPSATQPKEST